MKTIKLEYLEKKPSKNFTGIVEWGENKNKVWYKNGKRHRINGPAIERTDGYKAWYQNGKQHRTDGPAVIYANGYKAWWQHGKLHRTDGPARKWKDGEVEYWIHGIETYKEAVEVYAMLFPNEKQEE